MNKAYSVTQVNRYIKELLLDDALLSDLQVEGEISNFKHHSSGHLYFTLKDKSAAINCVMFASYANQTQKAFNPKNGDKVIITGNISSYEKTGQYQLYAINIKLAGEGDLAAAFVRLKNALQAEGLFDLDRKKPIPKRVDCVALITSPTGAAVQDMINVIKKRNPSVKIIVVPALVQGEQAPEDIARAIQLVNNWKKSVIDVIILGRGGGSMEDLQAFNTVVVARAISASSIPIISAVGHETDFTIADFAADLRALTPTAGAALAVPDIKGQLFKVNLLRKKAESIIKTRYTNTYNKAKNLSKNADQLIDSKLKNNRLALNNKTRLLEKLSPYSLWSRGYVALRTEDDTYVRSVNQLKKEQNISFRLQDGEIFAKVVKIWEN